MTGLVVSDCQLVDEGFSYCQNYLGGSWNKAKPKDFLMTHITGGLSNILYKCSLKDHFRTKSGEPRHIILRLYGQIIAERPDTVLNDSVIYTLLAERNLGPKLFGVFPKGRLEEFVPSRVLQTIELQDPVLSRACARIMARFHQLQMPMIKKPNWLFENMERYLSIVLDEEIMNQIDKKHHEKLIFFLNHNLAQEYENLKKLLGRVDSPVVFCHNDLQEGNILYIGDQQSEPINIHDQPHDIVRPIDFEYSGYNYRGFDIGNHFCEWAYNYNVSQYPNFKAQIADYPNKEQQLNFAKEYLKEKNFVKQHSQKSIKTKQHLNYQQPQLNGDNLLNENTNNNHNHSIRDQIIDHGVYMNENDEDEELNEDEDNEDNDNDNDVEVLLLEANAFALASHLFWSLWSVVQCKKSKISFGYMDYAVERLKGYLNQKNEVLNQINQYEKRKEEGGEH